MLRASPDGSNFLICLRFLLVNLHVLHIAQFLLNFKISLKYIAHLDNFLPSLLLQRYPPPCSLLLLVVADLSICSALVSIPCVSSFDSHFPIFLKSYCSLIQVINQRSSFASFVIIIITVKNPFVFFPETSHVYQNRKSRRCLRTSKQTASTLRYFYDHLASESSCACVANSVLLLINRLLIFHIHQTCPWTP